jgi:hypothetical protein
MMKIRRRSFAGVALGLVLSFSAHGVIAQETKPEVKRSEAKPIIADYVNKLSEASKESTGKEFTAEQKARMVDSILATMENQHLYAFVDP